MDGQTLLQVAQGNPGAFNVLGKIMETDAKFLNPLCIALLLTQSKSYGLWVVFKDMCKFDIQKTMATLKDWYDHSTEPLELWCEAKGFK
jgi:hypothetical protein